jgi:hypothetical protein
VFNFTSTPIYADFLRKLFLGSEKETVYDVKPEMPDRFAYRELSPSERFVNRLSNDGLTEELKRIVDAPNAVAMNESESKQIEKFDSHCNQTREWTKMPSVGFIRTSAVYFFTDLNLIRIHALTRQNQIARFSATVHVQINKVVSQSVKIDVLVAKMRYFVEEYGFTTIDAPFKLSQINNSEKFSNFVVVVELLEEELGIKTNLTAKIMRFDRGKSVKRKNEKAALICTKCVFFDDHASVAWWLEMNKQAGYSKISICNHSIPNNKLLKKSLESYKAFIEFRTLECIPNMVTHLSKYLPSYKMVTASDGKYSAAKFDVINELLLNECYLDNVHRFKFVSVQDINELILPSKTGVLDLVSVQTLLLNNNYKSDTSNKSMLNEVTCAHFNQSSQFTRFESFVRDIKQSLNKTSPQSLYFPVGLYVPHEVIERLFESIRAIKELDGDGYANSRVKYELYSKAEEDFDENRDFLFTITSKEELAYARSLEKLYSSTLAEYYKKYNKTMVGSHTSRVFFIAGEVVANKTTGKSVHDTSRTFAITNHYAQSYVEAKEVRDDERFKTPEQAEYTFVPVNVTQVSRFMKLFQLPVRKVPVGSVHFDFNYFNCYLLPFLEN